MSSLFKFKGAFGETINSIYHNFQHYFEMSSSYNMCLLVDAAPAWPYSHSSMFPLRYYLMRAPSSFFTFLLPFLWIELPTGMIFQSRILCCRFGLDSVCISRTCNEGNDYCTCAIMLDQAGPEQKHVKELISSLRLGG